MLQQSVSVSYQKNEFLGQKELKLQPCVCETTNPKCPSSARDYYIIIITIIITIIKKCSYSAHPAYSDPSALHKNLHLNFISYFKSAF